MFQVCSWMAIIKCHTSTDLHFQKNHSKLVKLDSSYISAYKDVKKIFKICLHVAN